MVIYKISGMGIVRNRNWNWNNWNIVALGTDLSYCSLIPKQDLSQ